GQVGRAPVAQRLAKRPAPLPFGDVRELWSPCHIAGDEEVIGDPQAVAGYGLALLVEERPRFLDAHRPEVGATPPARDRDLRRLQRASIGKGDLPTFGRSHD